MSSKFQSGDALCPYYQGEKGAWISCEGVTHDSCSTHRIFGTRAEREEAAEAFCYDQWQECPVARAIYHEKYEEE